MTYTQKLLSLFDTAAQAHGWASDQGTWAQAQTALTNYQRTRKDLELALDAQAAEMARLRGLVAEMAEHDTYETEYDGRMYSICHGCGAQDGEPHRDPNCLYVRAQAALSGESNG